MRKIIEKLKVKKLVKLIIYIVAISAGVGCSNSIEIKQDVSIAKMLQGTYYVKTQVWVKDWKGYPISLELSQFKTVKAKNIDSIKKIQLIRAEQIKKQLLPLVKH